MRSAIVAVAVAKDPACVDNLHVDDARHVLAWADAIAERATPRLTLRRQAHGETDRESRGRYWRSSGHRGGHSALEPSALAARSARAAVGARSGGDEGLPLLRDAGHRRLGPGKRRWCDARHVAAPEKLRAGRPSLVRPHAAYLCAFLQRLLGLALRCCRGRRRRPVYRDSTGTKETSKRESRRITPTLSALSKGQPTSIRWMSSTVPTARSLSADRRAPRRRRPLASRSLVAPDRRRRWSDRPHAARRPPTARRPQRWQPERRPSFSPQYHKDAELHFEDSADDRRAAAHDGGLLDARCTVLDFSRSAASNRIVVTASSLRLSLAHVVLMSSSSSWEKTPTTRKGEVLCLLDNETGMHSCLEPKPSVAGGNRRQEEASPCPREYRHRSGRARSLMSC